MHLKDITIIAPFHAVKLEGEIKMTDEEKKHKEEVEDLKEKNCPLSPTDWIMFLSGEIRLQG